ncbi:hypothetical protein OHC33_009649 [Knufia fluminis]|uniref:N-acetyltransferase domain-containing protein n=1 Tax=Knufia fluminis TaxID=191047 RepID=A0AAN8I4M2_9EURO|nr:hypothetical protein OHC33_009649 [Knufia fluminis]
MATLAQPETQASSSTPENRDNDHTGSSHTTPIQHKSSVIARTDKDAIPIASAALAPCFADDPVMNWSLRRPDGTSLNNDPTFQQRFFNICMAFSYGGHASFVTVDGEWKCVGVMLPPGQKVGGLRGYLASWRDVLWCLWKAGWRISYYLLFVHDARYISQFHDAAFPRRRDVMEKGDYYYIYFLGTDVKARGQGLGSEFLKYAQEVATKAGKPIYLESSKERNKALYLRHGFEVVKEVVMGEGEVGRDGKVVVDGEQPKDGVTWWAMTWWPKGLGPDGSSG